MSPVSATSPRPFKVDSFDLEWQRAKQIVQLTDLTKYFDKLVPEADEDRSDYDFSNDYGLKSSRLKALLDRFSTGYDWAEWQRKIQDLGSHFVTTVSGIDDEPDGLDVHYVVRKSPDSGAQWILLTHGWPGSFLEFYKMAPILSEKFHVCMPSIPGYTFSAAPKSGPTFTLEKAARVMDAVMQSLDVERYHCQGGDWGYFITHMIATLFPHRCASIHLNLATSSILKPNGTDHPGLQKARTMRERGSAYQQAHATIGAMLACSPVACLAWIGEKFYRWTDPATFPSQDEIITNCLLYYFTGSTTSSIWLYYTFMGKHIGWTEKPIDVPTAYGGGKHDIFYPRQEEFEGLYRETVSFKLAERGGHFLALENPEWLADDLLIHVQSEKAQSNYARLGAKGRL